MRQIRIGNDIQVSWEVLTSGERVSLEGRTLRLYVRSAYQKQEIETFAVEGCVVNFTYPAVMQKSTGARAVVLEDATEGAARKTICADHAFTLVAHSCEEDTDDNVEFEDYMVSLKSNILVGRPGMSAYEVWLSEGNEGTLEDWYAFLQKPAKDIAVDVAEAEAQRQESESARVEAEADRANAEQKRNEAEAERGQWTKDAIGKMQTEASTTIGTVQTQAGYAIDAMQTKASEAIRNVESTEASVTEAEEARQASEMARQSNEESRVNAEDTREASELARKSAEQERRDAEAIRNTDENLRQSSESTRQQSEATRQSSESARQAAEQTRETKTADAIKLISENNQTISDAESAREQAESGRVTAESNRVTAEAARVDAESEREKAASDVVAECNKAADKATEAAGQVTEAIGKVDAASARANTAAGNAEQAATDTEKCNITMEGSTITVTSRNGEQKSVDVVDTDETANLTVVSRVASISVSGIKINVYINNGKTPQQYTTDSEGKVSFTVKRGEYYEIKLPEYSNAQPISPLGFTATLPSRDITAEYIEYNEDTSEKVVVKITKYVDGTGSAWTEKEVKITYDGKTTTLATDSTGQATTYIPLGKQYTVQVDDENGYYVKFYNNKRSYTAQVTQRIVTYNMYQFQTGLYCVTSQGEEFTIDKWLATGRSSDEVIGIKIADQNLMLNGTPVTLRTSDLKNMSALPNLQWCTQSLQFESIALNGSSASDPYYYDGQGSTFLIRQEAQERSLTVPAADRAYNETLEVGGEVLHGFLMSLGQEYVHVSNAGAIREILRSLYGDDIAEAYYKYICNNYRWTSTQSNVNGAWFINSGPNTYLKRDTHSVLSVFAC